MSTSNLKGPRHYCFISFTLFCFNRRPGYWTKILNSPLCRGADSRKISIKVQNKLITGEWTGKMLIKQYGQNCKSALYSLWPLTKAQSSAKKFGLCLVHDKKIHVYLQKTTVNNAAQTQDQLSKAPPWMYGYYF